MYAMILLGLLYDTVTFMIYGCVALLAGGLLYKNYLRKKDEDDERRTTNHT